MRVQASEMQEENFLICGLTGFGRLAFLISLRYRLNAAKRTAALTLAALLLLSGCAGRELDRIAIITCLEVTRNNDGMYSLQAETVRMSDTEAEPGQNTEIITASGNTFSECISELNEAEALHIYLGHLRLIIFDIDFLNAASRSDLASIADFALSNYEIRFNTALAVSKEAPGIVICSTSASTGNLGIDLSERIRALDGHSELCDLINHLYNSEYPLNLPVIASESMNEKSIAIVKTDEQFTLRT